MIYFFDNELNMIKVATSKNVISAVHEHELNGLILGTVETDLSYTEAFINDVDYFGYYYKDNYYLHKIKRVEHEHENELVRITGRHIFFEDMLYGDYIRDVRPVNRDALYILNQTISANTRWQTVMTDTSKLHSETYYWVPPMEVLNDLIENMGIEYEPRISFDGQNINGFQLHVANQIGEDTPIRVPFGSRVINLKYEVDYSEIVTALYGHGKGEEVGDGYGRRINFSSVNFSRNGVVSPAGQLYMENPNVTAQYGKDDGSPKFGRVIFEDIESASELANATYEAYLEQSRPKMLFEASVVDLGDVGMGDGVLIIRREYDVYFNARIHKLMVDLLDEENADVELGDYAHFKESKVQRKTRENNNQFRRVTSNRIQQLKEQFNERFDGEVNQMREDFEQALIDAHAEIQAAEQRMETRIESERDTMMDEFNEDVQEARDYAEQQAQEKTDAVQSNLESFEQTHQQLYDEVTGDIMDIDTFLGDKTVSLKQQFDKVRTDFGTLQTELEGVSEDLGVAKTNLQKQLDDARAELEGLEVGGRNLILDSITPNTSGTSGRILEKDVDTPFGIHDVYCWTERVDLLRYEVSPVPINISEKYVFSFYAKTKNSGEEMNIMIDIPDEANSTERTVITDEWQRFYTKAHKLDKGRLHVDISLRSDDVPVYIAFWQLESGDKLTPWTPAPEDTEAKITSLNEQIEYIDGQLSAKLEQTDIEPINNKITEYGNTLTANSQSIQSLLDKTELHDGDITQWSNETEANAESISQTLTRVEETEAGISQAQTDIQTNADGIVGVIRDVETIDGNLSTLTTDFNVEAGKIEMLISKTDGHDTQLTNIIADYNSIEQTVAANDEWLGTHGSNVLQTVDGFEQKVWLGDITDIKPNMIPWADVSNPNSAQFWRFWPASNIDSYWIDNLGEYVLRSTSNGVTLGIMSDVLPENVVEGTEYTLSMITRTSTDWNSSANMNYTYLINEGSGSNQYLGTPTYYEQLDSGRRRNTWVFTSEFTGPASVMVGTRRLNEDMDARFSFKEPKLEVGDKRTPFMRAFSNIEQMVNSIEMRVFEELDGGYVSHAEFSITTESLEQRISNIDGGGVLTQSDIQVYSDSIVIGSQEISDEHFASIFRVSPRTIDAVAEQMRVSGDLYVKGEIQSFAMEAVEGEFARLWAAEFNAITIDVEDIAGRTAWFNRLYTLNANIERLVSQIVFTDAVHAKSLDAVYADLRSVNSEIMDTNILKADWIQGGNALLDKVFANTAMFQRMMAKSGFVSTMSAITLDLHELTIWRPDGVAMIQNGLARYGTPVPIVRYLDDAIETDDKTYWTNLRTPQTVGIAYGEHAGRWYNISVGMGLRWDSDYVVQYCKVRVEPADAFTASVANATEIEITARRNEGLTWQALNVPLLRPTYRALTFYIQLYRRGENVYAPVEMRYGRSWVSDDSWA